MGICALEQGSSSRGRYFTTGLFTHFQMHSVSDASYAREWYNYTRRTTQYERERASLGSQQVPNRISIITSHIKLAGESKYTNITYLVLVYCVAERR
jgi:hypothetical protein